MPKADLAAAVISPIGDIISDRLDDHFQHSFPDQGEEGNLLSEKIRTLRATLNKEQSDLLVEIDNLMVAVEKNACEHFYKLGIKDGFSVREAL